MSESAKTIIKYFCDRFLELDYYPTSIKAILDLELNKLKDVDSDIKNALEKIEITTIREASELTQKQYRKLLKKDDINESILRNIYISSRLISNSWKKRKEYLKKPQMKVVIAGLDFAGKTSLINRLVHNYDYHDLMNLEPTKGANIEEFQSDKLNLVLWDLGGQKRHVEEYLEEPEKFFVQVDVLIFVIDSQDDVRYDDAVEYLNDLLNIMEYMDEFPYVLVLLNKADSDIINDPDFQIKIEYLNDKVTNLFEKKENSWNFEIIPTSIYNFYSNEPDIAKSIKNFFSKQYEKGEQKIPEIDAKLEKILDINLKLMDNISSELSEMKRLLIRISPAKVSGSLYDIPFREVPPDFVTEEDKKKKVSGFTSSKSTPQPLDFSEVSKSKTKSRNEEILKKKAPKKPPMAPKQSSSAEMAESPPTAPPPGGPSDMTPKSQKSKVDSKDLNPPPPPPKTDSISEKGSKKSLTKSELRARGRAHARRDIISELKDLFKKRGIVE
jgi:small GTP-binding protein